MTNRKRTRILANRAHILFLSFHLGDSTHPVTCSAPTCDISKSYDMIRYFASDKCGFFSPFGSLSTDEVTQIELYLDRE